LWHFFTRRGERFLPLWKPARKSRDRVQPLTRLTGSAARQADDTFRKADHKLADPFMKPLPDALNIYMVNASFLSALRLLPNIGQNLNAD